jgi:hypothetical protein
MVRGVDSVKRDQHDRLAYHHRSLVALHEFHEVRLLVGALHGAEKVVVGQHV